MRKPSEKTIDAAATTSLNAVPLNNHKHHCARSVNCSACCMQRLCLGANNDPVDMAELETLIGHWHPMPKERYILREGDPFEGVLLVRSGSVKTCQTLASGEEQITGFHFPGEIFGMDGFSTNAHINSAVTLETTSLCMLPLRRMLVKRPATSVIELHVLRLLSELLHRKDEHSFMLSKNRAHKRLAAFLLDLSYRFERRHLSSLCFCLSMSRTDVSRYLGLSLESVSRAFALLEKDQLIKSSGRMIELTNKVALESLADVAQASRRATA